MQILANMAELPEGFDGELYLKLNPDVAAAGLDPGEHYVQHGRREDRRWRLAASSTMDTPSVSEGAQRPKDGRYYSRLATALHRVGEDESHAATRQFLLHIATQYGELAHDLTTAAPGIRHPELMRICERLRNRS